MKTVIDGVRYHVEECGDGFPLVLLHGFTGSAQTWRPFCGAWGRRARLIMPDLIGHGETDAPADPARYAIARAAGDLRSLLDQMGIGKADLLGYSMGGRVAITFASLYPERVRKLVLESTTPGLRTEEERQARMRQDGELAARILERGIEWFADYWEALPLFASQRRLPAEARERIRRQRLRNSPLGLANSLRGMGTGAQPSWWDRLGAFDFDVLLITGALDEKFCRIAGEMLPLLPRARHVTVPGCGHAVHVEEPERFAALVGSFIHS